ncbi:MAG: TIGR02757 family protein [Thermodesulfobacteriota bacterium]
MSGPDANIKYLLEDLYRRYNRRTYVSPDPLACIYAFENVGDREIAGLVSACLAYGRVAQIVKSVDLVLAAMGGHPHDFVCRGTPALFGKTFAGFRHRFADGRHMAALLAGMRRALLEYGSLNACFNDGLEPSDATVMPALCRFASRLAPSAGAAGHLLPDPGKGSACKRLHLFLRWMVRNDRVDPGGWTGVSPAQLVVPLDIHMHTIGLGLGLTRRRQADMTTALEITQGFARFSPGDPVKYDFALTRFGIRREMSISDLVRMASNPARGKP